jgi:uncharacterized protein
MAPEPADGAIMLDMIHYLSDDVLILTLERLHGNLARGAWLLIRVAVPGEGHHSWLWKLETIKSRVSGCSLYYRPVDKLLEMLKNAGFQEKQNALSGSKGESVWLMAENN